MKSVLFLCTGNYYRSRLAEELLRLYASNEGVSVFCSSAGLGIIPNINNRGPIATRAIDYLKKLGIEKPVDYQAPRQCTQADISSADIIVCMNEQEHRLLLEKKFAPLTHKDIRHWNIPDVGEDPDSTGPESIDLKVRELLRSISTG